MVCGVVLLFVLFLVVISNVLCECCVYVYCNFVVVSTVVLCFLVVVR